MRNTGKPTIHLAPTGLETICFNESSAQILANFAVEWTVQVDGGPALLVFGQNNIFYQIAIRPGRGVLTVHDVRNFVGDERQDLGDIFPAAIRTAAGALNTVRITRLNSTITLSVNGEEAKVFSDRLFGDHAAIKVGFGAAVDGERETVVALERLNIYLRAE